MTLSVEQFRFVERELRSSMHTRLPVDVRITAYTVDVRPSIYIWNMKVRFTIYYEWVGEIYKKKRELDA